MICGVGIDLVDVERMERLLERWGERAVARLFTPSEIRHCRGKVNRAECFAARFAAKEALAKALGHGWCEHFRWLDVEVVTDRAGKPSFVISGITRELVLQKRVFLSMTHIKSHSAAIVVTEEC
ncbi:MAG: holo-[acyl-carrier-protein] synthase [Calditrichaeota bacterium]|nr:MAG: holo-[acyl-carrier-protein] synthase [Calditrichota bacterium]